MSENNNEPGLQPSAHNEENNEMENANNQNKTSMDMNTLMKNIDLNSLIKNMDLNSLVSQRSSMTKKEPTNDVSSLMKSMNLLSSLMKATSSIKNNDLLKSSVKDPDKTVESPIQQQNSPQSNVKNENPDLVLLNEKMDQILQNISELNQSVSNELSEVKKQNKKLYDKVKNRKRK